MRRAALRAGLAAVLIVVAFVPPTLAEDAEPPSPASDTAQPGGPEQASPPAAPAASAPPASAPTPPAPAASGQPAATPTEPPAAQNPSPQAPQTASPSPESAPSNNPNPTPPPAADAPPPPADNKPAENKPAPPPPTKSVLDKRLILGVLGKEVKSAKGEDMGRIVDVIVDWSGQTRAAIIDFGGFLGVGSRRIAVDWNALHFAPTEKEDQITLDLTRDQVKSAPEYKEGKQVVVLGPSGATETMPYD